MINALRPRHLGVALLVVLSAGCSITPVGEPGSATPSGGPAGITAEATPADGTGAMEKFRGQQLTFGSCADYATTDVDAALYGQGRVECARLEAPLDYAEPAGRTIQLAILRVPATGERQGSVMVNPGGPAAPGTSYAATLATLPGYGPLGQRFDLVGFDMRGTGASTPAVDCFTDAERERGALVATFMFAGDTWDETKTGQVARDCAVGSGGADVISHLGTRDTVQDMDLLRAVLGEDELNFLGASYGTRLGAAYAATFPDRVRSMVLDGGMDPGLGITGRMVQQFAGFQATFETMATACATDPACPLGTDPALADQRFQALVRPLIDSPITMADGRELTYRIAVEAMLFSLYHPASWVAVTTGLTELAAGGGATLLAIYDSSHMRQQDGSYPTFAEGAFATHCNDKERLSPEDETALREKMLDAAPFMDDGRDVPARDSCADWPGEPTLSYPYASDVDGLPRTLVVSITGDPAAPYEGSSALAEALGATHITVEGDQHGAVYVAANSCVDDIVTAYLIDPDTATADARCVL